MQYEELSGDVENLKWHYKFFKNGKHTLSELKELCQYPEKPSMKCVDTSSHALQNASFQRNIEIYEVTPEKGLFYIPNPFTGKLLTQLLREAIVEWPISVHKMNLDIESDRPSDVWNTTMNQLKSGVDLKKSWLHKLRWISLGYHYHWTEKSYRAGDQSPFPASLASVSRDLALLAGFPDFIPEAGIVNFYHQNSSMGFHVDHAEIAQEVPLVSISLGQPCVFLIGGEERTDPVVPIVLQHGDVIIMSGPSRLAYHAVPRILISPATSTATKCPWCDGELQKEQTQCHEGGDFPSLVCENGLACRTLSDFVASSRVNINVRQVLREGQSFPTTA